MAWFIQEEITTGNWHGFKSSRNGPTFTHLFYADDLILFTKASKKRLPCYQESSRHLLQCFKPKNKPLQIKNLLLFLHSPPTSLRSLLMSLESQPLGTLKDILELQSSPIKEIQELMISLPIGKKILFPWWLRRLTLINSVTIAIPTHLMQCNLLPPKICKEIDRLTRNFLWGDSIQKKKIHLKNWDLVDRPKFLGGLGI